MIEPLCVALAPKTMSLASAIPLKTWAVPPLLIRAPTVLLGVPPKSDQLAASCQEPVLPTHDVDCAIARSAAKVTTIAPMMEEPASTRTKADIAKPLAS